MEIGLDFELHAGQRTKRHDLEKSLYVIGKYVRFLNPFEVPVKRDGLNARLM